MQELSWIYHLQRVFLRGLRHAAAARLMRMRGVIWTLKWLHSAGAKLISAFTDDTFWVVSSSSK